MPYDPGPDVVEVVRAPKGGPVRGTYRAFGETLRGMKTVLGRWAEGPHTYQYPEEKTPVYPRFRGRHKLHRFEDTGLEKCVGCSLCAAACPAKCIRVVAAENTPDNQVSAGGVLVWIVWVAAAAACLLSAVGVVSFADPFYSALALIGNLASLAVLYLLLSAEFVAAAQVLIYAGAIVVMLSLIHI